MSQLHPASSLACLAAAGLLGGMTFYAEPFALATPAEAKPVAVAKPEGAAPTQPAECPEYAQALADSKDHRVLVVVTFNGCPACAAMKTDLKASGVPFAEVNRERHPQTFTNFRAASFPTWYIFRNGSTVASGARRVPAKFLKQVLQEDGK